MLDFSKKSLKIISKYDFLIHTSNFDANPSTVLEGMSWGLIPVLTKECGYEGFNKNTYIPLKNLPKAIRKLNYLQKIDESKLKMIQRDNYFMLKKKYNWNKFRNKIKKIIFKRNIKNEIKYTSNQIKLFEKYKKNSEIIF